MVGAHFAFIYFLSELSTYAIQRIAKEGLISYVFHWLKPTSGNQNTAVSAGKLEYHTLISSAELLNVITEEFEPIKNQITDDYLLLLKVTLANQKQPLRLRSTVASRSIVTKSHF